MMSLLTKNRLALFNLLTNFTSRKFIHSTAFIQSKKHAETFPFLANSSRESKTRKTRKTGQTEIRGPYYSPMGKRYLSRSYIDSLKFAGGSFTLYSESGLKEIIDLAHKHDVSVSTGGFIERVLLAQNIGNQKDLIDKYMRRCKELGYGNFHFRYFIIL